MVTRVAVVSERTSRKNEKSSFLGIFMLANVFATLFFERYAMERVRYIIFFERYASERVHYLKYWFVNY